MASEPARAVALYETFISACNEKAEEVDDSDGEFGTFAGGLYCGWIAARQSAGADRSETGRFLLEWTDDPASPRAQALAARWRKLRAGDCSGDPKVHAGLLKAWNDSQYWPEAVQDKLSEFNLYEISQFIARVFAAYRKEHYGDIAWAKELDSFTPEEKERFPLAALDVSFKIEESHDSDPAGETGQASAARWMEVIESRTGSGRPNAKIPHESLLRWIDGWPEPIHRKMRSLNMEKNGEFILRRRSVGQRSPGLPLHNGRGSSSQSAGEGAANNRFQYCNGRQSVDPRICFS